MQFRGKMSKCDVSLNKKECQMKIKTKQSRPDDFVENPAATYMENNFRGLSFQLFCFFEKDQVGWRVNLHSSYNEYRPITMYKIAGMTSVKEKKGKVNYDCARPNVPYHRNLSLSLFNFPLDGMLVHCVGLPPNIIRWYLFDTPGWRGML